MQRRQINRRLKTFGFVYCDLKQFFKGSVRVLWGFFLRADIRADGISAGCRGRFISWQEIFRAIKLERFYKALVKEITDGR